MVRETKDVSSPRTDSLLRIFEQYSLAESKALRKLDTKTHNVFFKKLLPIEAELKARGQREALAALYEHADPHVRYNAAVETLGIFPDKARAVLQKISDRDEWPSTMYARGILHGLDDGTFKPT